MKSECPALCNRVGGKRRVYLGELENPDSKPMVHMFCSILKEQMALGASLIRPLFSVDDDCYVGLTGDGPYSSCISPDVNKCLKLQESSSVYPKLINFVYPSEDEIKAHCDTVYITASTSVNKPIDLTSPDFDDSFTGFDLTQIMNVSEVTSCKSVDFSLDSHLTSFKT
ncbi:unnamed protein product, partial [Schistosoma curassoni]|uniref:TAXi_C domain-containing protein n=1 Tax=Schistosoma curassoni TaxID=6186 RepID=A0A183L6U0_9TREM